MTSCRELAGKQLKKVASDRSVWRAKEAYIHCSGLKEAINDDDYIL